MSMAYGLTPTSLSQNGRGPPTDQVPAPEHPDPYGPPFRLPRSPLATALSGDIWNVSSRVVTTHPKTRLTLGAIMLQI